MAKISHTKIKQPSFGEKKAKINLHQTFPIYGIRHISWWSVLSVEEILSTQRKPST
jgi:hypothetical protein